MSHRLWRDQHFQGLCWIPQIFHKILEITQTVDLVRSHMALYEEVRYDLITPKGHTFSFGNSEGPWAIFGQYLLISLLTKSSRNMSIGNKFNNAQFFGMSYYDQHFFRIWKYGPSAFKRTINHVSKTPRYVTTLWNICVRKSSKKGVHWFSHIPTWLPASYIYEERS